MSFLTQINLALTRIGVELKARTPKIIRLASNVTSTSSTPAAVAGLSFSVVAGKSYHVKIIGLYQSATAINGARFGFTGTATLASMAGNMRAGIASTAANSELAVPITSIASVLISTGVNPTNTPHTFMAEYVFNCTAGGTHQMQFGAETNGLTSVLLAGTSMIYQEF